MSDILEQLQSMPDKVDTPERLAMFQAYGEEKYADAAFLNLMKRGLIELLTAPTGVLINDNTNSFTLQNQVANTILRSYYFPPNLFKDGDFLEMITWFNKLAPSASSVSYRYYIGTAPSIAGSTQIAFCQGESAERMTEMSRPVWIENGFLRTTAHFSYAKSALYSANAASAYQTIPYNVSQGYYWIIAGKLDNQLDNTFLDQVFIRRTPKKTVI